MEELGRLVLFPPLSPFSGHFKSHEPLSAANYRHLQTSSKADGPTQSHSGEAPSLSAKEFAKPRIELIKIAATTGWLKGGTDGKQKYTGMEIKRIRNV